MNRYQHLTTAILSGVFLICLQACDAQQPTADSPSAAAAAEPIRMGPPFHFDTGSRTRGREGLVTVGLKDANGCTLRLARKNGQIVQPTLKLLTGGSEVAQAQASYG